MGFIFLDDQLLCPTLCAINILNNLHLTELPPPPPPSSFPAPVLPPPRECVRPALCYATPFIPSPPHTTSGLCFSEWWGPLSTHLPRQLLPHHLTAPEMLCKPWASPLWFQFGSWVRRVGKVRSGLSCLFYNPALISLECSPSRKE